MGIYNKFLLLIKVISCLLILFFIFAFCFLVGARFLFGEDGDPALVISHISLIKSYPMMPYIKEIIMAAVSFLILSYLALRYWKFSIICCLLTVVVFVGKYVLFHKDAALFSQEYIKPQAYFPNDLTRKNIIVISLESFENIFALEDLTNSGNLIPNMSSLEPEGVSFEGYVDMLPMRPTIPSYFAKNCGIPTRTSNMSIYHRWAKETDYTQFPNAKCVFDILKDNGYHTFYMMGAHLTDEGAASFFEAHPTDLALGRKELKEMGASQKGSIYMIPDSEMYGLAEKLLSDAQNFPFGLYIVTGGTHGSRKGTYYTEDGCQNTFGDFRDSISCLDKKTYDFVKWCQAQPWYKDTVIYLIGDHLMRDTELNVFSDEAKKYPQRQVVAFMLSSSADAKTIKRKYTQVDFAPTFLESLGFVCPALGLGRSLFRDEPTLVEKMGANELKTEIENSLTDFQNIIHGKTY